MEEAFLQGIFSSIHSSGCSPPFAGLSLSMPRGRPHLPPTTIHCLMGPPSRRTLPVTCSWTDRDGVRRVHSVAACPRRKDGDGDGDGPCRRAFSVARSWKDGVGQHRDFPVACSRKDGDGQGRTFSVASMRKDGNGQHRAFSVSCLRKDGDGGRRASAIDFSWKDGDGRRQAFSVACLLKDSDGGLRASAMVFSRKNRDRGRRAFSAACLRKVRDGRSRSFSITCLQKDGDGGHQAISTIAFSQKDGAGGRRASAMDILLKNVDGNGGHQAFTMANLQRNRDGRRRISSITCMENNGDGGWGGGGNGYPNRHSEEANEGRDNYPMYHSEEAGGEGNDDALLHGGLFGSVVGFIEWVDAQKEQALPQRQRRGFYTHDDWLLHRSSTRHIRHMLSSLSSRVILSLIPPVSAVTAISAVLATYNSSVASGLLPSFMPLFHANSLPYELTAPALALLLVFRTDAAYSRYDEGRKTWTKVIGSVKNFARQSTQMIQDPHDLDLKSSLLSYIMSFPLALKCHLIHGLDAKEDLSAYLDEDDLELVLSSQHRPNCLLQLMAQSLSQSHLKDTERTLMEENIMQLNMSISVCERLIRTPIPLSYTRLTSRFLVLWHLTLPVALWDSCNWLVVPATLFSATTLFCIEEVGVLIEEPFSMMALGKICGIVCNNIAEIVEFHEKAREHLIQKREKIRVRTLNGALTSGSPDTP